MNELGDVKKRVWTKGGKRVVKGRQAATEIKEKWKEGSRDNATEKVKDGY